MASHHQPSAIRFPKLDKTVQLRFGHNGYDLTLLHGRSAVVPPVTLSSGQLRQVTVEMQAVETGPLKLSYEGRDVVIRANGKVWIKVPDILFMRLHSVASVGAGENFDQE